MPRDPTEYRQRKAEYLTEAVENGDVSESDAERIREVVDAFDEKKPTVQRPAWPNAPANLRGPRSEQTLGNWCYYMTRYAKHTELSTATPHDVNQVSEDMLSGDLPEVKDGGMTKGSIRQMQNAVRIFYRYHDGLEVDWGDVSVFSRTNDNGDGHDWGPDDILDREEIDRIQAECTDYRHSAIFNLLLYTGIRNRALRTLRIKDVDPEEGTYRFNPEEGTKDIHEPRAPRPLFGAKGPVREWLRRHPTPDDPEAYLITTDKKFTNPDPSEPVSDNTIGRICKKVKEAADVTKPMHPHMLRHNFVYICKRVYEIPDDTIRFFLGHAEDSTIMEQTYSHLSAADHLMRGRKAAGEIDEIEDEMGFELSTCNNCGAQLPQGAKACPTCGTAITPDAKQVQDRLEQQVEEEKDEADDLEEYEDADKVYQAIESDDKLKAELINKLQNGGD